MKSNSTVLTLLGGLIFALNGVLTAQASDIEVFVNHLCSDIAEGGESGDASTEGITPCIIVFDEESFQLDSSVTSQHQPNSNHAVNDCSASGISEAKMLFAPGGSESTDDYPPMPWSDVCYADSQNVTCDSDEKWPEDPDAPNRQCSYWIGGGQTGDEGAFLLPPYAPDKPGANNTCPGYGAAFDPEGFVNDSTFCVEFEGGTYAKWNYIDWMRGLILGKLDELYTNADQTSTLGGDATKLQEKIIGVKPLRNDDFTDMTEFTQCMALVKKSDLSINVDNDMFNGNLQGDYWGHIWFSLVDWDLGNQDIPDLRIVVNPVPEGGADTYVHSFADYLQEGSSSSESEEEILQQGGLQLLEVPALVASPAVSVDQANRLFHDDQAYISMFRPDVTLGWIGNLKKYALCKDTSSGCELGELLDVDSVSAVDDENFFKDTSKSYWSTEVDGPAVNKGGAGEMLPIWTNRTVYTYLGDDDSPSTPAALDAYSTSNDAFKNDMTILGCDINCSGDKINDIINWVRGKDLKDEDNDDEVNESRPWAHFSPLHSRPRIIVYPNPSGGEPILKIVYGTNEGAVRMIDAATGVEDWAFIAPVFLKDHMDMYINAGSDGLWGVNIAHVYGLDGSAQVLAQDTDNDGSPDKHTMVIGCRRGCDKLYALDISMASDGTVTPKFAWRIHGGAGDFATLGETWSAPLPIAFLKANGLATAGVSPAYGIAFGAGYDPSQDTALTTVTKANGIFIVDPASGAKLLSIGTKGSGADVELAEMDFPIPSDLTAMDGNGDGLIDRLYFTDTAGQVWRVDLAATLSSSTGGILARLGDYQGESSGSAVYGGVEANKRRMYYPPEIAPIFDGEGVSRVYKYDVVTVATGYRAHPLDKIIEDRIYAIRDYLTSSTVTVGETSRKATNYPMCGGGENLIPCTNGPITEAELYDTTDNEIQVGSDAEKLTAKTALKSKEGWFIKLVNPAVGDEVAQYGEKALSKTTIIDGKLFVTTYVPPQTCNKWTEQGFSRLYALELLTGGAIFPAFDGVEGLLTSDRYYKIGKGLPSKAVPVFQEGGVTLIVSTGGGSGSDNPGVAIPVATTFWFAK